MTTPELFAIALGRTCAGPNRCLTCGAACGEEFPTTAVIRDTFTGWAEVPYPTSPWVCPGCVLAFADRATLTLLDGTDRQIAKNAIRSFSWFLTPTAARAGTKADLARWRELLLTPPPAPWACVLSDRGQKHLIYRGVVNRGTEPFSATLEGERIDYRPAELADRLALSGRLWSAGFRGRPVPKLSIHCQFAGHPCPIAPAGQLAEADLLLWDRVRSEPLTRLAAWLVENPNPKPEPSK